MNVSIFLKRAKPSIIWILLLLVVFISKSVAQNTYSQFDYLTIAEGLPHNTVYCLTQDQHGFVWIGTKDGLVRYDGHTCKLFRKASDSVNNFGGKSIHSIIEDKNGNLWIGTQSEGIIFRDSQTGLFRNLSTEQPFMTLAKKWVKKIYEDKQGRIWIGTIGNGLWCYTPKTKTMRHFDNSNSPLQNAVSAIIQDEKGRIWVGTNGVGIYQFDEATHTFRRVVTKNVDGPNFQSFRKVFFSDQKGNLWVGTEGAGLYKLSLSDNQITHYTTKNGLSSDYIMGITQNKGGQLLLATDGGGLSIFDMEKSNFTTIKSSRKQGSLNTNALYNAFIDKDENLWIGTFDGGINIYKAHKTYFETFTHTGNQQNELSHRSVLSLCETKAGQIYVGTDGGGLNLFHSDSKKFENIPNSSRTIVKTLFEDSKKRIWLGYFEKGMSYFNPATKQFKHFGHNPTDATTIGANNVWSITEDKSGTIWAGILGGGVAQMIDPNKEIFKRYNFDSNNPYSISSNDVMVIFADKNDRIWVGTDTKGLNLLDKLTGKATRFQHKKDDPQSLSANDIRCIFEDSKGRLWIGTESGGLNIWLGNGKFKKFSEKDGLLSNSVMSIIEDPKGFLWIGTYKGLCRISIENNQFLNFHFSENSYFKANQFNQAAAFSSTTKRFLFWGGINGLTVIHPDNVKTFMTPPKVVFTDFKIFNQSVGSGILADGRKLFDKSLELAHQITLSYKENAFSFEVASLDFTDTRKNKYLYQLEGFDKKFQSTDSEQRTITYTNLNPGKYLFRVKGSNSYGIWSEEKHIELIITPPFWKTWWFRLLMLLITFSIAVLALKIYTARR